MMKSQIDRWFDLMPSLKVISTLFAIFFLLLCWVCVCVIWQFTQTILICYLHFNKLEEEKSLQILYRMVGFNTTDLLSFSHSFFVFLSRPYAFSSPSSDAITILLVHFILVDANRKSIKRQPYNSFHLLSASLRSLNSVFYLAFIRWHTKK